MKTYPAHWTEEVKQALELYAPLLGPDLIDRPPMMHVAGTNGKGSICAYLYSILRCAGYDAGLFSSPHLYHPTERILRNGEPVHTEVLDKLLEEAQERMPGVAYFQQMLYAALHSFDGCDIAVMEAGIGGLYDITNLLSPVVSVLANMGLDHRLLLGDTLYSVAFHKAGIAKPGTPMVIYPGLGKEALMAVKEQCELAEAPMVYAADLPMKAWQEGKKTLVQFTGERLLTGPIVLPLLGAHQAKNAQTAVCAALCLPQSFRITPHAIEKGLQEAVWHGRLELKTVDGQEVLLDGAHNVQSAEILVQTLKTLFPGQKTVLLCAMMEDKDVAGIAKVLAKVSGDIIATQAEQQRGMSAYALCQVFRGMGKHARAVPFPKEALAEALALAKQKDALLVAAGTLYLPKALGL